jgi:hypothetical protein
MSFNWKASGLFAAGVAFGTAGIKILSSKDAKRAYTQCTAAALRAKDCVMKTVNTVQENAEDILAEAKSINEEREAKAEAAKVSDASEYASVLRLMSRKQSRLRLQQRLLRHRK